MNARLIGEHAPNSPEWHALRRGGIGASEIAAVVGLSPFTSAFALWHLKAGNIAGPTESEAMRWGHRLEPVVADWWAERHPEYVVAVAGSYAHADRLWQRANPDRLLHADGNPFPANEPTGGLEIKTTRFGDNWGPTGTDAIPLHVRCQVMQTMDVFGFDQWHVAVLIGGNDPREYVIDYDPADATALREAGAAFWASLQTGDEPPIDASFDTYQTVRELHPDINGLDIDLDPKLWVRYTAARVGADEVAEHHQHMKSQVLAAMGNARRALVNGRPVLRRQPTRNGVALYPIKEKTA